ATALALLPSFPNLVVTRTFSKAYALAGLRVGYAVAHPGLAQLLERLRASFNVNALGLAAAEAALADQEHLLRVRTHNAGERAWLIEALRALPARAGRASPEVFPSQANFLLVGFGADAAPVEAALLQRGIVPRPMQGYGLPDCLRITIGTRAQNERLLAALRERP